MEKAVPRGTELAPQEVFQAVWQRRWTAAFVVALCLGAGAAYLKLATPLYTATSRLYVMPDLPGSPGQVGWRERSKNYLSTQCELLKSGAILGPVAELPDVKAMKVFADGGPNPLAIKDALTVQLGNKDDLIEVSVDAPDPKEAARVVNAVVESYAAYQTAQKRTSASEMLKILRREKDAREQELADKRLAVLAFKQGNPELSLQDDRGGVIVRRLTQLSEAKTNEQLHVVEATAAYETVRAALADPSRRREVVSSMVVDGTQTAADRGRAELQNELFKLHVQLAATRSRLALNHPSVVALAESVAETERKLGELDVELATARLRSLEQASAAAKQRLAAVEQALQEQQQKALELNATTAKLAVLESRAQQAQTMVEGIDARIKELGVGGETGALNVSVLEWAAPADKPSKPRKPLVLAASGLLGLVLGSLLAFVRASTDRRLRSAEQIEHALGVPVLSAVPRIRRRWRSSRPGSLFASAPGSELADAYRTIRTAIHFGSRGNPVKTLVVTSAVKGEGKSTVAANIAAAMAQAGERTLLVDADLRRPSLHKAFRASSREGLSSVLRSADDGHCTVSTTGIHGLDLLPAGPVPPNPSELLGSQRFQSLLRALATRYDRVVLDAPPVLGMPDALILGAVCEATILVVRADVSDRHATEAAFASLVRIGVRSLATVVNAVTRKNGYSRYVGGYYHDEPRPARADVRPAGDNGEQQEPGGDGIAQGSSTDGSNGRPSARLLPLG